MRAKILVATVIAVVGLSAPASATPANSLSLLFGGSVPQFSLPSLPAFARFPTPPTIPAVPEVPSVSPVVGKPSFPRPQRFPGLPRLPGRPF